MTKFDIKRSETKTEIQHTMHASWVEGITDVFLDLVIRPIHNEGMQLALQTPGGTVAYLMDDAPRPWEEMFEGMCCIAMNEGYQALIDRFTWRSVTERDL